MNKHNQPADTPITEEGLRKMPNIIDTSWDDEGEIFTEFTQATKSGLSIEMGTSPDKYICIVTDIERFRLNTDLTMQDLETLIWLLGGGENA